MWSSVMQCADNEMYNLIQTGRQNTQSVAVQQAIAHKVPEQAEVVHHCGRLFKKKKQHAVYHCNKL